MKTDTLKWEELPNLPDAEGFAGSYAGVHNETLLVAGGANFPEKPLWEGGEKVWTDAVLALQPGAGQWEKAGRLPGPLGYGAAVSLPMGVMLIGGCNADGATAECLLLTYRDGKAVCEPLAPLPTPLTGHSAVLLGEDVYVFGGSVAPGEQDARNHLLVYSPATDSWNEQSPLPGRGRFLHQMAALGDKLYVLGGIGLKPGEDGRMQRDMLIEAWLYDADEGWQHLADLPRFCAAAPTPAPVLGGEIYLLGGDDGTVRLPASASHPGFHSAGLCYNPAADEWREIGEVAAARAVLPCAEWCGRAVIVNGEQSPGKRSNQVWTVCMD